MATQVGGDDLGKKWNAIMKRIEHAIEKGTMESGELMKKKIIPRAPIDSEKLRLSIYTSPHNYRNRHKFTVEIGSMGAVDRTNGFHYAIIQHETPEFKHPNGGQYKYIEAPVMENRMKFVDRVARKIRLTLKRKRLT